MGFSSWLNRFFDILSAPNYVYMKILYLIIICAVLLTSFPTQSSADVHWLLGGEIRETYTDNVTYTKNDPIRDAVTGISLLGGAKYEGKNTYLDVKGRVTQNIYASHSEFNNISEDIYVSWHHDLTPYDGFTVRDTFQHGEDPFNFESAFGRTSGRYSFSHNYLDMSYARILSKQWTAKLNYRQFNDNYSRSDISDSVQYSPGVETIYEFDSAHQALLSYDFDHRTFDPGESASTHTVSTGYRHYLTNQWVVELKPGVSLIDSYSGRHYTKPRYEASLTEIVDKNTTFKVKYVQSYAPTSYNQDIFNSWRWVGEATKQLSDLLIGRVSAFFGKGEYVASEIRDKLIGANVNIEYALTKHSDLFLSYSLERTDSNTDTRDYTRNMVTAGIKFSF